MFGTDIEGRPQWWSWFVVIGGCLTSAIVSVVFSKVMTDYAVRKSQQTLCTIVVLQDDVYRQTPPATPTGKKLAEAFVDLRSQYRCP